MVSFAALNYCAFITLLHHTNLPIQEGPEMAHGVNGFILSYLISTGFREPIGHFESTPNGRSLRHKGIVTTVQLSATNETAGYYNATTPNN